MCKSYGGATAGDVRKGDTVSYVTYHHLHVTGLQPCGVWISNYSVPARLAPAQSMRETRSLCYEHQKTGETLYTHSQPRMREARSRCCGHRKNGEENFR